MKIFLLFAFFCALTNPLLSKESMVKANGIEICYETFGNSEDPALLMVMGGCCQGIMWPNAFCEMLADQGFYVIRYDHRDTGLSTCFNYQTHPYTLLDMAEDGIGLLDALKIEKAHLFSLSMGGPIAELMSTRFPGRVVTLTLMATSADFRPLNLSTNGEKEEEGALSSPTKGYLKMLDQFFNNPPKTQEDKLQQRLDFWHLLNGSKVPLLDEEIRPMHTLFLERMRFEEGLANHMRATFHSENLIREVPYQVCVPTLVIQGSEDPIFQKDHGEALSDRISHARYLYVEGLGHVPNPHFYSLLVSEFISLTKSQ